MAQNKKGKSDNKSTPALKPPTKVSIAGEAKKRRIERQAEREKLNRDRRSRKEPTPWEIAKMARKERRQAEGKHADYLKREAQAKASRPTKQKTEAKS